MTDKYLKLSTFTSIFVAAILSTIPLFAQEPVNPDAILGIWETEHDSDNWAHVEIFKRDDLYSGRIIWLNDPLFPPDDPEGRGGQPRTDDNNQDESLRDRPVIGLEMVFGFKFDKGGKWKDGRIYDPDNGKTYKCKMELEGDGTMKVRGFIGFSMLGRTTRWTRVPATREQAPTPETGGGTP